MTEREIRLIQESFRQVNPIAGQATAIFYARLFELDPALRGVFRGSLAEQGRDLLGFLGHVVAGLERLDALLPAVREFGFRHADQALRDYHFECVGEALLWTLSRSLGAAFTGEHRAAWSRVYWHLAETAKAGARDGVQRALRASG
jgi:hemoglobin-like flavoprotein